MTSYTAIADTEIDAESPVTEELMTRMRDNPIAITEGATGAPRITLAALEELVAGASARTYSTAEVTTTNTSGTGTAAFSYYFLQRGTIRVSFEHKSNDGSNTATAYVLRTRAGSVTTLTSWTTTSTTYVARTYDATIQAGDMITVSHKIDNITRESAVQAVVLSTDGGNLWPTVGGVVTGNSV